MAERNQLKTKVELTLNSQHVWLAFIGALIAMALVFSLGVMVGKRLNGVAGVTPADDALAAVQQQEDQYQKLAEVIQVQQPEKADAKAKEDTAEQDKKAQEEAAKLAKLQQEKEAAKKAEQQRREKEEARLKELKKKEREKQAAEERKAKQLAQQAAKEKEKTEDNSAASATQTPAPQGKYYTLQIASFPSRDKADSYVSRFKAVGNRKPFITPAEVPGKGTWYRVKIGKFETKEQALAFQSIFEARTKTQSILALE